MMIRATELARLLRDCDHAAAAAAAEAGDVELVLTEGRRDDLLRIYRVRKRIQADAGRPGMVAQIERFLSALNEQPDQTIHGCSLSDAERHYMVFLNSKADAIVAVLVPPRRPDGSVED